MNKLIKDKIIELFNSTPNNIGVSFGKKTVNGKYVGRNCIVFTVEQKKSLDQIPENEILPTTVEIDGIIYETDVYEVGKIKTLVCEQNVVDNCYWWQSINPTNQDKIRPLMGGIQITSFKNSSSFGTLGFIAIDTVSSALVGVTNNHVVVGNSFYTTDREVSNIENESSNIVYQNEEAIDTNIGNVIRYVPIYKKPAINNVDAALISVNSSDISFSESYKQSGLSYTNAMMFATTEEIDDLLINNPEIYNSGRKTGAKEGICGLTISGLDVVTEVYPYHNGTISESVNFQNLISFTRINPDCSYPVESGDSGSALIANFSGTWKIIGIVFAGSSSYGLACRIDEVASQLGISAWDGTTKPFIDLSSKKLITLEGVSNSKTINCDGDTYWQIGSTLSSIPCSTTTTTTTPVTTTTTTTPVTTTTTTTP